MEEQRDHTQMQAKLYQQKEDRKQEICSFVHEKKQNYTNIYMYTYTYS